MTHRELGAKILAKLTKDLTDIAEVEVAPKMEGYQMFTIFVPKKVKPEKKKAAGHTTDQPNVEPEKKREPKAEKVPVSAPAAVKDPDEIF